MGTKYSKPAVQKPVSFSTPALPQSITLPQVQMPQRPVGYYPAYNKPKEKSYLSNYNDPFEINSVADAVLNVAALRKKNYFGLAEQLGPLYDYFGRYVAAGDLLWSKTLDPLLHGKFKEAGLNLLMNFGETMDILANPVKGLIMDGPEGLIKGIGHPTEGRVNYDWDTGSLVADIGLEVISDPLNWISLGSKSVATIATKPAMKAVISETAQEFAERGAKVFAKEVTSEVAEEATSRLAKQVIKTFVTGTDSYWDNAVVKAATKMSKTIIKPAVSYTDEFVKAVADKSIHSVNIQLLKGAQKMVQTSEVIEKGLRTAVLGTSFGPIWWAAKRGYDWIAEYNQNLMKKFKVYENPVGTLDMSKIQDIYDDFAEVQLNNIKEMSEVWNIHPTIVHDILLKSLEKDASDLMAIVKKLENNPAKMRKEIITQIAQRHQMEPADFLKIILDLDIKAKGQFNDLYVRFKDMFQYVDDRFENYAEHQAYKQATAGTRNLNLFQDSLLTAEGFQEGLEEMVSVYNAGAKPLSRIKYSAVLHKRLYWLQSILDQATTRTRGQSYRSYLNIIKMLQEDLGKEVQSLKRGGVPTAYKERVYTLSKQFLTQLYDLGTAFLSTGKTDFVYIQKVFSNFEEALNRLNKGFSKVAKAESNQGYRALLEAMQLLQTATAERLSKINIDALGPGYVAAIQEATQGASDVFANFLKKIEDAHKSKATLSLTEMVQEWQAYLDRIEELIKAYEKQAPIVKDVTFTPGTLKSGLKNLERLFEQGIEDSNNRFKEVVQPLLKSPHAHMTNESVLSVLDEYERLGLVKHKDTDSMIKRSKNLMIQLKDYVKQEFLENIYIAKGAAQSDVAEQISREGIEVFEVDAAELYAGLRNNLMDPRKNMFISELAFKEMIDEFLNLEPTNLATFVIVAKKLYSTLNYIGANVPELRDSFEDTLDILYPLRYVDVSPAKIRMQANDVIYRMKNAQLYNNLSFFMDDLLYEQNGDITRIANPIVEFTDNLMDPSHPYGQIFENLRHDPSLSYQAEEVRNMIVNYQNYREFLSELSSLTSTLTTEEAQLAILDTIQNFAQRNLTLVDEDLDTYLFLLFTKAEQQMGSTTMAHKITNEEMVMSGKFPELEDLRKEFAAKTRQLHRSEDDIAITEAIHQKMLGVDPAADPNKVYVYVDIESTGLTKANDQVLEISYKIAGQDAKTLYAKADRMASEEALAKAFPQSDDRVADFYKTYHEGLPSEEEVLLTFTKQIQDLQASGKQVVLVGHNISSFDNPFIRHRLDRAAMRSYEIYRALDTEAYQNMWKKLRTEDTLLLLRKKFGFYMFSESEKEVYSRVITRYIERQMSSLNSPEIAKLIQPLTGDMAKAFIDFGNVMQDYAPTLMTPFRVTGGHMYSILQNITSANDKLRRLYLNKSVIENLPGFYNSTKLLSEGVHGLKAYAVAKAIDHKLISHFFDLRKLPGTRLLKDGRWELELVPALYYNRIARVMDFYAEGLRNLEVLQPKEFVIDAALKKLIETYPDTKLFSIMRTDVRSLKQKWAMLAYSVRRLTRNKIMVMDQLEQVPYFEQIRDYLTNPPDIAMLKKKVDMGYGTKLTEPFSLDMPSLSKDVSNPYSLTQTRVNAKEYFRQMRDILQSSFQPLQDLCRLYDKDDMYIVSNQRLAAAMETISKLLIYLEESPQGVPRDMIKAYGDNIKIQQVRQVLSFTPEEMQRHLYHNAMGFIRIGLNGYAEADKGVLGEHIKSILLKQEAAYNAHGIQVIFEKDHAYLLLHQLPSETPKEFVVPELDLNAAIPHPGRDEMYQLLQATREQIAFLSDGASRGTFGEYTSKKNYEVFYEKLPEDVREAIDPEYRRVLLETDDLFKEKMHFNHSNIGSTYQRHVLEEKSTSDIVKAYAYSTQVLAQYASAERECLQMHFSDSLSINNSPIFAPGKISDKELVQLLKDHTEFRLVALVQDEKYEKGYRLLSIQPHNEKSIALARKLNASLLPTQSYSKLVDIVNKRKAGPAVLQAWKTYLYAIKIGYLSLNVGTPFRNIVDGFVKNMNSVHAAGGTIADMGRAYYASFKLYMQYVEAIKGIMDIDLGENRHGIFEESIQKYFTAEGSKPVMTQDEFMRIYNFLKDGPSAGQTEDVLKFQESLREAKLTTPVTVGDKIRKQMSLFTRFLMKPNIEVEQIHRLAQYLMLLDNGSTKTVAFDIVSKTHFDYTLKSESEKLIELVIPFYTFRMRNAQYWVDTFLNHPWYTSLFRDVMTPIWNFDDYSYDELSRNQSLQYQILSGALPLSETGLTLKLSFSAMDAFQMLTDPLNVAQSSLAPPLKLFTDIVKYKDFTPDDLMSLVPYFNAVITRYKSAKSKLEESDMNFIQDILQGIGHFLGTVPNLGILTSNEVIEAQSLFEVLEAVLKHNLITDKDLMIVFGSVFGMTRRWEERRYNKNYRPYKKRPRRTYARRKYAKKTYHKKRYTKKFYAKRSYPKTPVRYRKPYIRKSYHRPIRTHSFYRDLYTTTGKSRLLSRMIPVTAQTLKYRIKDYSRYY